MGADNGGGDRRAQLHPTRFDKKNLRNQKKKKREGMPPPLPGPAIAETQKYEMAWQTVIVAATRTVATIRTVAVLRIVGKTVYLSDGLMPDGLVCRYLTIRVL